MTTATSRTISNSDKKFDSNPSHKINLFKIKKNRNIITIEAFSEQTTQILRRRSKDVLVLLSIHVKMYFSIGT